MSGMKIAGLMNPSRDNIEVIFECIHKVTGVTKEQAITKNRQRNRVVARNFAAVLMREVLGMGLVEIGQELGGRNHATMIHALKAHGMDHDNDPKYAWRFKEVMMMLGVGSYIVLEYTGIIDKIEKDLSRQLPVEQN